MTLNDCIERLLNSGHLGSSGYESTAMAYPYYIEIPFPDGSTELPVCIVRLIKNGQISADTDKFIISIKPSAHTTSYRSLEAAMKQALRTTVKDQFYKVEVGQDNYYVTDGLVFNSDFLPIMCLSWKLEKNQEYNQGIKLLSPCLHILPDVVINKSNSMERFITGKFLSTALSTYSYIGGSRMYAATTAEIGPMPFTLRAVDTPSINTTNEQLLQLADSLL